MTLKTVIILKKQFVVKPNLTEGKDSQKNCPDTGSDSIALSDSGS